MIRRLVFTCLEDIRDGFEEELKEMKPMKKPLQNTEKLTDMNTKFPLKSLALRKFEFVDFCKKPKQTHENRGAALLAKMGYDGGGLDKSSQGVTELIPFSTQRGREGFGQPANQKIARDWNVVGILRKKMYCGYLFLMTFERSSQKNTRSSSYSRNKICKIKTTGL
ncbi:G-patch domain family protein [Brugia pahangi]